VPKLGCASSAHLDASVPTPNIGNFEKSGKPAVKDFAEKVSPKGGLKDRLLRRTPGTPTRVLPTKDDWPASPVSATTITLRGLLDSDFALAVKALSRSPQRAPLCLFIA